MSGGGTAAAREQSTQNRRSRVSRPQIAANRGSHPFASGITRRWGSPVPRPWSPGWRCRPAGPGPSTARLGGRPRADLGQADDAGASGSQRRALATLAQPSETMLCVRREPADDETRVWPARRGYRPRRRRGDPARRSGGRDSRGRRNCGGPRSRLGVGGRKGVAPVSRSSAAVSAAAEVQCRTRWRSSFLWSWVSLLRSGRAPSSPVKRQWSAE